MYHPIYISMYTLIADEMLVIIGGITCSWRIMGLPNRLQHLDDTQDILVDEGTDSLTLFILSWTDMSFLVN